VKKVMKILDSAFSHAGKGYHCALGFCPNADKGSELKYSIKNTIILQPC